MDKRLKEYNIVFSSLKLGEHRFGYDLNTPFFEVFGFDEFTDPNLHVDVDMVKKNTMLEFEFSLKGTVVVRCDITDLPFEMEVSNSFGLLVKFGDAYNDEDDEVLILPHGEYEVNIAQYLFELAALSLPQKRVHPDVKSGKIGGEMLEKLRQLDPEDREEKKEENDDIDPRWDKLKDLLN